MNLADIMQLIITLMSALAAVLAWVAKIRWSKEYAAAKDETIKSRDSQLAVKDEQLSAIRALLESKDEVINSKNAEIRVLEREIDNLRELTPMKIQEYFVSVKSQLEAYNEDLKQELKLATARLQEKDQQIKNLVTSQEIQFPSLIESVQESRQELQTQVVLLEAQTKQNSDVLQQLEQTSQQDNAKIVTWAAKSGAAAGVLAATTALDNILFPGVGATLAAGILAALRTMAVDDDKKKPQENATE